MRTAVIRQLIPKLVKIGPAWFRRLVVTIAPFEHVKLLKRFSDVLINTSDEVLTSKEREMERGDADLKDQIANGKDIMSILRAPSPLLRRCPSY